MDSGSAVEATAESVVREYLSRKGLKETLKKMDEECPRHELSISNRQALMKQLNLEKLMKKNKENPQPFKAMLEIMTKHFIERRPQHHTNEWEANGKSLGSSDGLSSDNAFSPQTNEPMDSVALRPAARPTTAILSSRREKAAASDLVVDDDIEGESLIGEGKSGLFSSSISDSPVSYNTKTPPSRPLSSRQRTGAIISNDDTVGQRRRGQMMKPKALPQSRMSVSQQEQQRRYSTDVNETDRSSSKTVDNTVSAKFSSSGENLISSPSPDFKRNDKNKRMSMPDAAPVSFEALLMKGEERANLLQRIGLDKKDNEEFKESYKVETSSMSEERPQSRLKNLSGDTSSSKSSKSKMVDLEVGDVDDLEADLANVQLQASTPMVPPSSAKLSKIPSTPVDLKTAVALKTLVLGSPNQQFNEEWRLQAFSFCDIQDLKYGIVQKKGGPCGVLAAVQACFIQEMLFGENKIMDTKYKNVSRAERSKLLALSLSHIFWRAGDSQRAVVALPSDTCHLVSSTKFKQDDVTEKLSLYTFNNYEELSSFMMQSVSQFETDGCPGVILVMYSAILSRKPYQVRYDFDVYETTMIASHGYCTQELVNLMLTGKAVSNTFNDVVRLDSDDGSDSVTLKGISGRSEIGLLSLFEHYKSCQVGTYLKTPRFPIWVVCSESHFSVLYSSRRDLVNDWKAERRFDLMYYDGLARQQEEIKLTISTINQFYKPPSSEEDLVPPLEHCIRTKWSDAEIDWNGYEPIL
ncbi:probable ubiquitin carboxyl-terminal hydrolase MINDY-4 [Aplysia californica]|uniref:Ubiquitin carboxyl-terminal hydrolase MINDY n=1 Tax=Aplysia californica TaxID=6500 RepID=A0ABM0JV73_APLCA|nr:probable ubiquitin carboxyl-terminal hydrolase MINDY-4 [Aplysia californica]